MTRIQEQTDPNSCLNKAKRDEPLFVLRAKDPAAIATVIAWIDRRLADGTDARDSEKVRDAMNWCQQAAEWRAAYLSRESQ